MNCEPCQGHAVDGLQRDPKKVAGANHAALTYQESDPISRYGSASVSLGENRSSSYSRFTIKAARAVLKARRGDHPRDGIGDQMAENYSKMK